MSSLLQGAQWRGKAALQNSSCLPRTAAMEAGQGQGCSSLCPGLSLPLPSWLWRFWHRLTWLPALAPGDGQVVGAAVTLLQADFLSPGVGNPRSGAGPWNVTSDFWGVWCRSPRPETGCLEASWSPSDAHRVHAPVLEAPAPKKPWLLSQLNQHF